MESDTTQVNHTLDSDPKTFPLDRMLYVECVARRPPSYTTADLSRHSFSHDNQMAAIASLIGLFDDFPLSATQPDPHRRWVFSHIAPFAGRVVTERLSCSAGEHVRILVNDAVQPLGPFCEVCRQLPSSAAEADHRAPSREPSPTVYACCQVSSKP